MSDVVGFTHDTDWFHPIEYEKTIDYFFTQRKVVEFDEYIDEKTLDRKKKRKT